ncbi:hypothetical protein [uncultured Psychroserpens sp.]|uniref:hypothetical protein n=1 Tax=uncultured Psychroserpens sp. TaxID=255436 RepID=UPI00262C0641|nr:hypothetical protein [uncultured Psychroserpens sp.]
MNTTNKPIDHFINIYSSYFDKEQGSFKESIQKLTKSWSVSGFNTSLLTPSQYPVEFSYNFKTPSLSYTIEVLDALESPSNKWSFLNDLLKLSLENKFPELLPFAKDKSQKFGLWLSVRHILDNTYYKIYQEVTHNTQNRARHLVESYFPMLNEIPFEVKLIGHTISKESHPEFYFSFGYINEAILFKLLKIGEVQSQTFFLLSHIAALRAKPYEDALSEIKTGLSLKVTNHVPVVTVFFHAPELFNDNTQSIKKIKKLARELDGNMQLYEQLTKPVNTVDDLPPIHSVLSFKISTSNPLEFSVGLSPYSV